MNRKTVAALTIVAVVAVAVIIVAFAVQPAAGENKGSTAAGETYGSVDIGTTAPTEDSTSETQPQTTQPQTIQPQTDPTDPTADVQAGVTDREDFDAEQTQPGTQGTTPAKPNIGDSAGEIRPEQTTPETTQPSQPADAGKVTYAMYEAMSEEDQEKFVESFDSVGDFVDWWNQAKKEAGKKDPIVIEDGKIDLGKLP